MLLEIIGTIVYVVVVGAIFESNDIDFTWGNILLVFLIIPLIWYHIVSPVLISMGIAIDTIFIILLIILLGILFFKGDFIIKKKS